MVRPKGTLARVGAGVALLSLAAMGSIAATINLAPTRIVLSNKVTSASLVLRNDSDAAMRFQITAARWTNDASGRMALAETNDLVFFPALFVLEPRQSRRVRVASSAKATERELAYRLAIEQLPAAVRPPGQGVQMLVRASVPVFVQPSTLTARATLDELAIAKSALSFAVRNTGTVHVMIREAIVSGRLRTGGEAPEQRVPGWYLLAGEQRRFTVPLPPDVCRAWSTARATVAFSEGLTQSLTETIDVPASACGT